MVGLGINLPQKKRYQLYFRSISILGSTSISWVLASRYSQAKIEVGTKRMKIITKMQERRENKILGKFIINATFKSNNVYPFKIYIYIGLFIDT